MINTIYFNRYSYDPFIDYIKGISIIFVILNHCIGESLHSKSIYCLWGDSAVPLLTASICYQDWSLNRSDS